MKDIVSNSTMNRTQSCHPDAGRITKGTRQRKSPIFVEFRV